MFRRFSLDFARQILALSPPCQRIKGEKPRFNVEFEAARSKFLFDRAMDALKHNRYDVPRPDVTT